jgi:hypothetical protein
MGGACNTQSNMENAYVLVRIVQALNEFNCLGT